MAIAEVATTVVELLEIFVSPLFTSLFVLGV
jgi:hypothetical protein